MATITTKHKEKYQMRRYLKKHYLQQYLKDKMNALGWDQQELVEQTGLPRTTVANLLHGQNLMPKIPTVGALADALEVPPHEIMEACGVPLMAAPKDETRSEQAQRFGRVIDSIEPLRELYDILQGANLSQIEDVVTYARNVVRNKN